jgi:hypothetical protein
MNEMNEMNELVLDIKIKIATTIIDTFGDVWYKLSIADDEFARYARSDAGIQHFIDLFTEIKETIYDKTWYSTKYKMFDRKHRNHVDNFPACITYWDDEIHKAWYYNGAFHREHNKPACIISTDNVILREEYKVHGKYHRDDNGPSYTSRMMDGTLIIQKWYKNGELHRDNDMPAVIDYRHRVEYYRNGRLHRDGDNPAYIDNGEVFYYKDGILHRDNDEPAVISRDERGYYKNGNQYTPTRYVVAKVLNYAFYVSILFAFILLLNKYVFSKYNVINIIIAILCGLFTPEYMRFSYRNDITQILLELWKLIKITYSLLRMYLCDYIDAYDHKKTNSNRIKYCE